MAKKLPDHTSPLGQEERVSMIEIVLPYGKDPVVTLHRERVLVDANKVVGSNPLPLVRRKLPEDLIRSLLDQADKWGEEQDAESAATQKAIDQMAGDRNKPEPK